MMVGSLVSLTASPRRKILVSTSIEKGEARVVPPMAKSSEVAVKYVTVPPSVNLLLPVPILL